MMLLLSGRTITYKPRSGSARSVTAIVDYPGPGSIGRLAGGSRPHVEISVCNSSGGILSTEIDTGGDRVTVPMRRGLPAKDLRIAEIISQDEGMLRLLCY
jgi:hypothetical protein